MQTYTHYVVSDVLGRKIRERQALLAATDAAPTLSPLRHLPGWRNRSALIGSIAPDMPLTLAFLFFLALDLINKTNDNEEAANQRASMPRVSHLFGTLFFKDWRMKLFHNLFHAPMLTLLYTGIGYVAWKRDKRWGSNLFWFGFSCTLHTIIDIPLHYDDGPLLLFPFDWETRYYSPVSYWDTKRYGGQFRLFEHALLFILLLWLLSDWWHKKENR